MTRFVPKALIVAAFLSGMDVEVWAQTSDPQNVSLVTVIQVPPGEVVSVTNAAGQTIRGTLVGLNDQAVDVRVKHATQKILAADVSRIEWQKRDSALNGILIGGAIGAVHGIYWLIADPNECTGLCSEDYVAIGVGAVVGGLIDRAIKKKVTVYDAAPRKTSKVTISPLLIRDRRGVQLALTF